MLPEEEVLLSHVGYQCLMLQIQGDTTASNQAEGDREGEESIPLICSSLSTVTCSASKGSLPVHLFGVW